jgi:hypothetical protein
MFQSPLIFHTSITMPTPPLRLLVPVPFVERRIHPIRGLNVLLDRDLAALYGVKAIALRQQVKRNRRRFPADFMFKLTAKEAGLLVSPSVIPSRRSFGGPCRMFLHRRVWRCCRPCSIVNVLSRSTSPS